jgi:hypothetical protein
MAVTLRLNITEMVVGQSGGENLFNTALRTIDATVMLSVLGIDVGSGLGSPANGDVWLVAGSGTTGVFNSKDNQIAYYDQGWKFIVAEEGMTAYIQDDEKHLLFDGTNWINLKIPLFNVSAKTANFNIEIQDNGTLFTNTGASGTITGTLPVATVGLQYYFAVGAAEILRVDPDGSETITTPADTPATTGGGKYLENVNGVIGETLHVICAVAGTWNVIGHVGLWTNEM